MPMTAEETYKRGFKPYCRQCEYYVKNESLCDSVYAEGKINGKIRKKRLKYGEAYCTHGELRKINRNHIRWWGFSRDCAFNLFKQTCLGYGVQMCTEKRVCSGCLKNNSRFNGDM